MNKVFSETRRFWRGFRMGSVAWLLLAIPAGASEGVVLVRGSELPPYQAVEAAFTSGLGQEPRMVNLTRGDGKDMLRAALADGSVTFVVGPDAARAVLEIRPKGQTLYALLPNPTRVGLDSRALLVSMFPTPVSQLRPFKQLLPKATRLGVLYDPSLSQALVDECGRAAAAVGLTLVRVEVKDKREVAAAARGLIDKVDAIWLLPDTTVVSAESFKFLVQISLEAKVPLIGFSEGMARAGALVATEVGYSDMGRKASEMVKKMLAGAPVSAESPDGKLFVNGKTAELLGVPLSSSLRTQASKVIE